MDRSPESSFWHRIQRIPRHYIYLLLAGVVAWQLLFPIQLPVVPSSATKGVYDAIAAVPDDKLVVISTDWDASTEAETAPQTQAVMHACFQHRKRFAIMNLQPPMGVKLANDLAEEAAREYGAEYGVDWCNWGYKYGYENVLMALGKNVPKAVGDDFYGKPVTELPMMEGVADIKDVGIVVIVDGFLERRAPLGGLEAVDVALCAAQGLLVAAAESVRVPGNVQGVIARTVVLPAGVDWARNHVVVVGQGAGIESLPLGIVERGDLPPRFAGGIWCSRLDPGQVVARAPTHPDRVRDHHLSRGCRQIV